MALVWGGMGSIPGLTLIVGRDPLFVGLLALRMREVGRLASPSWFGGRGLRDHPGPFSPCLLQCDLHPDLHPLLVPTTICVTAIGPAGQVE